MSNTYWPIWRPVPKRPWVVVVLETGKYVRNEKGEAYTFRTAGAALTFIEKLEKTKEV